jgi:hypothetical protein
MNQFFFFFFAEKKVHFVRMTSGDSDTKTALSECELHICEKTIPLTFFKQAPYEILVFTKQKL